MGNNLGIAEGEHYDLFGLSPLVFYNSEILSYISLDWPILLFLGVPPFLVMFYGCNLFRLLDKGDVSQG